MEGCFLVSGAGWDHPLLPTRSFELDQGVGKGRCHSLHVRLSSDFGVLGMHLGGVWDASYHTI